MPTKSERLTTVTGTVSSYLITRLQQAGLQHLFAVPGDYAGNVPPLSTPRRASLASRRQRTGLRLRRGRLRAFKASARPACAIRRRNVQRPQLHGGFLRRACAGVRHLR